MTRHAFSLIEVLIAVAIFFIAVVALSFAFSNTLQSLATLEREYDFDTDLRFVRSIVIQEPDLDTFEEGGEVETLGQGMAVWNAFVEPTSVTDLFRVELTIEMSPLEAPEAVVHEEILYLLRPTWSDPVDRSALLADATQKLRDQRWGRDWDLGR